MADNFFGFSERSFEQLIQSLAVLIFGPGTVIFGSGPDGGREATFSGEVPFPNWNAPWKGYGVIQAKYKQKTEGTQKDQKWALGWLEKELKAFVDSDKRDPKPEYYIFATNVVLTPAPKSGGRDEAARIVDRFRKNLGLKDYRIWDQDHLTTYLNTYRGLRARFSHFLTAGDVLARLIGSLKDARTDFLDIASLYLDRELRAARCAKLDQAGQRTDERTELAKVFIDLPSTSQATQNAPDEKPVGGSLPPGLLAELIVAGDANLDPRTLRELAGRDRERKVIPMDTARFVLMGGPGSGKSTLGQFLAQIHRAALLDRRPDVSLDPQTQRAINGIKEFCERNRVSWPNAPRYPFHVPLSDFADALAGKDETTAVRSLAEYLGKRLGGDQDVSAADVYRWLSQCRWLLVLDGLDEVPASSNRADVCRKIQDFLAAAAQCNADLMVLASTREEGYNDEFGREDYAFRFLPPLSTPRALSYAERFAGARYGDDRAKINQIVDTLERAAKDDTTAKLMRSPLQVTFMITLVASGGEPPRDRWKLFNEYFNTIYKRELQKCGALQDILRNQETIVRSVHHEVGFILQQRGETVGESEAGITLSDFIQLVDRWLEREGHRHPQKADIRDRIAEAAMTRLVFLTSRVPGKVSFEIRSLQEYMAAEYLSSSGGEKTLENLRTIGPIDYWRNVFLFVAGKCFADTSQQYLRDPLVSLCEELNESDSDRLAKTRRTGARLALSILADGAVRHSPTYARKIVRCALRLLELPHRASHSGAPLHKRLSEFYDERYEREFQEVISPLLHEYEPQRISSLGAWLLLLELVDAGIAWATDYAEQHWPKEPDEALSILSMALWYDALGSWPEMKAMETIWFISSDSTHSLDSLSSLMRYRLRLWDPMVRAHNMALTVAYRFEGLSLRFRTRITSIFDRRGRSAFPGDADYLSKCQWASLLAPLRAAAEFCRTPTKECLASVLETLWAECPRSVLESWTWHSFPWPLSASIGHVLANGNAERLITAVRSGQLGDTKEWCVAEKRWRSEERLNLTHQQAPPGLSLPFDGNIDLMALVGQYGYPVESLKADGRIGTLALIPDLDLRRVISYMWCITGLAGDTQASAPDHQAILEAAGRTSLFLTDFPAAAYTIPLKAEWRAFADWVGRTIPYVAAMPGWIREPTPVAEEIRPLQEQLASAYVADPSLAGILRLLAAGSMEAIVPAIPRRPFEIGQFEDARIQEAALCVQLAQPDLSMEEVPELAQQVLERVRPHPDFSPSVGDLPQILIQNNRYGETHREFALCVREALPAAAYKLQAGFDEYLSNALRQRRSGIQLPT